MADDIKNIQYQHITPIFSKSRSLQEENTLQAGALENYQYVSEADYETMIGEDKTKSRTGSLKGMSKTHFAERFGQDTAQLEESLAAAYRSAFKGNSSIVLKSKRAESAAKKIEIQQALNAEMDTFDARREFAQLAFRKHIDEERGDRIDERFESEEEKDALREWMVVKSGNPQQPYKEWEEKINDGLYSGEEGEYVAALKNVLLVCQNENTEGLAYTNDEEFIEKFSEKYAIICQIASGDVMVQKYIDAGGTKEGLDAEKIRRNIERCKNLKAEYELRMELISSPYHAIVEKGDVEEYMSEDGEMKLVLAAHDETMEAGLIEYIRTLRKIECPSMAMPQTMETLLENFRRDKRFAHANISNREWNLEKGRELFGLELTDNRDPKYELLRKNTISKAYTEFITSFLFAKDAFTSAAEVTKVIDQLLIQRNLEHMPDFDELGDAEANLSVKRHFLNAFKEYIQNTERLTHEIEVPQFQFRQEAQADVRRKEKDRLVLGYYVNEERSQFDLKKWTATLKDFVAATKSAEEQQQFQDVFDKQTQEMQKVEQRQEQDRQAYQNGGNPGPFEYPTVEMPIYSSAGSAYLSKGENVLEFDLAGTNDDRLVRGVNRRMENGPDVSQKKKQDYFDKKYGKHVEGLEHVLKAEHEGKDGAKRVRYNMGGPTTFNGGENSMQNVEARILEYGSQWLTPILNGMQADESKRKDVHVILTGLSRGAASTTAGVMRLSKWLHDNYPDLVDYVKFETVLHDPTPGFGSRSGIFEKADLSSEKSYDRNGKETADEAKKVYRGAGKNISSTVFYSLKSGGRLFLDPQKVMGADRVIISPYEHIKTYEITGEAMGNRYRKRPFLDPTTGAAYRGSGINALPKGLYFADDRNVLYRIDTYDQYVNLMERLLKDVWRDVLRTDVINEVAENFFKREG